MGKKRKELSTQEKHELVEFILPHSRNGRIGRGIIPQAANRFGVSCRTVARCWATARDQRANGQAISLKSGRYTPRVHKRFQIDLEFIQQLEMGQRSTIRILASGVGCSRATVGRWLKQGLIRPHTNAIKLDLTAHNKLLRLKFSLEALEIDSIMHTLRFKDMQNVVHIDEKWFYMTKGTHRFYIVPGEIEPHRTWKSKKFIEKVMFMCAVCRPMYKADGSTLFDGKICIYPFTEKVPAKRSSKNRAAGIVETKAIQSITKNIIRDCIINKIIPDIKMKWPSAINKRIFIQQDNTKPHINNNDEMFREAANRDGFEFILIQQPPNSPDTNVNNLGWFRSIEVIQHTVTSVNVDELVAAVIFSFQKLDATTLNNVFISLQGCFIEIMGVRGSNNYKLPHIGKTALIRAVRLPEKLNVSQDLVKQCISYLMEAGQSEEVQQLRNTLTIGFTEDAYDGCIG